MGEGISQASSPPGGHQWAIVPETHALHPAEHFILVVGYNPQTDEMIYNSHNRRQRLKASKLLGIIDTFSLVNRHDWTGALYVPLPAKAPARR